MNKKKLAKAVLKESRKLKKLKRAQKRSVRRGGAKRAGIGWSALRLIGRLFAVLAAVYAALFAVFFFDLDGKLLFYVVEPFLVKHYDKMERKNPLDMPYDIK